MASNIVKTSEVPGGIDAEITVTFLAGSEIVTAIGSAATAWVRHPVSGVKTAATTATVTAATKIRVKWPFNTLPDANYWLEAYLTPPAGTPGRAYKGSIIVTGWLGP